MAPLTHRKTGPLFWPLLLPTVILLPGRQLILLLLLLLQTVILLLGRQLILLLLPLHLQLKTTRDIKTSRNKQKSPMNLLRDYDSHLGIPFSQVH